MTAPDVVIYVRHSAGCKYGADESAKRCDCRKWLRWTVKGKRHREPAGTRTWAAAELRKREIEDQLAGRSVAPASETSQPLQEAIDVFLTDKRVQGVSADPLAKYTRELGRLREFLEARRCYTVQGLTREALTLYCETWPRVYPSSQTRVIVRARLRSFLRYCYEAKWLERVPVVPKMTADEVPTMPLSGDEFARLLRAMDGLANPVRRARGRSLILLMRFSGLAIGDALRLKRSAIQRTNGVYRVVTNRQKTGTHVSVPIPPHVALEVLATPNDTWEVGRNRQICKGHPDYLFWDGTSKVIVRVFLRTMIDPAFAAAKIVQQGAMKSHRLRDTFAVDLLEKGVPMEEVSRLLGHTSIRTTERSYAKWSKGRQDRVDSLVSATW